MKIGDGDSELNFLGHSGFFLKIKGKKIAIDPYRVSENVGKADLILITHSHNNHYDLELYSSKYQVVYWKNHILK